MSIVNSTNMTIVVYTSIDPSWLPSAIMQTIGALFGVFIAIFIVMVKYRENMFKHDSDLRIDHPYFKAWRNIIFGKINFMKVSFVVYSTIIYNAFVLFALRSEMIIEVHINKFLFISLLSLVISILFIAAYSYNLLKYLTKYDEFL